MKGYIKGKNIILLEDMPENLKEGDEVNISIIPVPKEDYPFPTFELGIKDEYLNREKIDKALQRMFTEESVSKAELSEGLEDYCLNKAMDEAKDSPLLDRSAALEFLEEKL